MAGTTMSCECARRTGSAVKDVRRPRQTENDTQLTDAHHDEEASEESTKVHHGSTAPAVHEIIRIRASVTYPIRQRRYAICRNDEESEVVAVERRGEDDEEEAYC